MIRVVTMSGEIKYQGDVGPRGPKGEDGKIGKNLEFDWQNTSLGVRQEGEEEYQYRDLQGPKGQDGYDDTELKKLIGAKVDKVDGKGLSTNDYTTEEKEKLENTPIITNEDVQKWNNKSDFDGSYESLKDKPSIPTKTSELENDSGFAPVIISTTDLEDGVSELATGTIYIVYEE